MIMYRIVIDWHRPANITPQTPSRLRWVSWPELLEQVGNLRWLMRPPRGHRISVESREDA